MKYLLIIIFSFSGLMLQAQNAVNEGGRKDGHWVVKASEAGKRDYAPDAIYEEGDYSNGRKIGAWKTYYADGKLKSTITFENGRPKGPYKTYFPNGQLEEDGNWSLTQNYGTFKRFYEDGTVHQEFEFNDSGKRTGTQKYYHPNGKLAIEGNWAGGKESGEVKEYYETGELRVSRFFNDGVNDDTKTKQYKSKILTNVPAVKEPEPVKDENNKVKAAVAVNQTQLKSNIGVFDGNGAHTLYNTNRQIAQKGVFKDGKLKDGKIYRYNRDGILERIEIYQAGKYIGEGVIEEGMN